MLEKCSLDPELFRRFLQKPRPPSMRLGQAFCIEFQLHKSQLQLEGVLWELDGQEAMTFIKEHWDV